MDRLTRPEVDALQTAVRFMGTEVKIQDIGDKLLHLIMNGPTINSINKDTLRHLVRQLYTELKQYEDLEMTPETIEQQLTKRSLLFSKRLRLAQMSEEWNRQNGVRECALSTITYLHANNLIDNEKALAFIESAEKKKEDIRE